ILALDIDADPPVARKADQCDVGCMRDVEVESLCTGEPRPAARPALDLDVARRDAERLRKDPAQRCAPNQITRPQRVAAEPLHARALIARQPTGDLSGRAGRACERAPPQ